MPNENPFANSGAESPKNFNLVDEESSKYVDRITFAIKEKNPIVLEFFRNKLLLKVLREKFSDEELVSVIENSMKFGSVLGQERSKNWNNDTSGFFGEATNMPESYTNSGRKRLEQSGCLINVDYLKSIGIDPEKVLFFRITQPEEGENKKPEIFWTSDFFETVKGLSQEIPQQQRKNAVILIASLDSIYKNGGPLIEDINDDNGLSVAQIGLNLFDQDNAIAKIPWVSFLHDK